MNSPLKVALALTLLSDVALANGKLKQQITTFDQHVIQNAPADNFSGKAQFSRLPVMPSEGDIAPATVTFAPNAITNWHIHPNGQYLIVIDGEGRTQEWGKPIQNINKGDAIWCPPGVKHWHGASERSGMTHIAISPVAKNDAKVTWLEKVELPQASPSQLKTKQQQKLLQSTTLSEK